MNYLKNRILSFFSEKIIVISGKSKVHSFKISYRHYFIASAIFFAIAIYLGFLFISIKTKEMGLARLYNEKKQLESINNELSTQVDVLAFKVEQIDGYLDAIGKDIGSSKANIKSKVKPVQHQVMDYKKPENIAILKTSVSNVIEKINDRKNHLITVAKNVLPNNNLIQFRNVKLNEYDGGDINIYKVKFSEEIGKVKIVEKEIEYMPVGQPVYNYKISSNFGKRLHPVTHKIIQHNGIDLKAPSGAEVYATGSGTVRFAGKQNGFGNLVIIAHKNNITTKYAHLKTINVTKGQRVQIAQKIGVQGNTGCSTGEHVHYEVLFAGKNQHPYQFISAQNNAKRQTASK